MGGTHTHNTYYLNVGIFGLDLIYDMHWGHLLLLASRPTNLS